jgi:hypothetical protein
VRASSARSDSLPASLRCANHEQGVRSERVHDRVDVVAGCVPRLGREIALEWVRCLRGSPSNARM